MIDGEIVKNEDLNLRLDNVRNCKDAIPLDKEFDNIMKYKKKGILNLACKQGVLFKKFKEFNKFKETLREIGISISTTCFKVKLVKVSEKHPKLKNLR